MYDVVYLPTARKQLTDAALYIATELSATDSAENLLTAMDELIGKLCNHPYRHPVYPTVYAMKHEIRYIPVKNYLVFYVVKEEQKTVEIWRSLHQRHNMNKRLRL